MIKGVKDKDIRDFEKYASKLAEIIDRIVEYCPAARIYVTPQEINLMVGFPEDIDRKTEELVVSSTFCSHIESGDW